MEASNKTYNNKQDRAEQPRSNTRGAYKGGRGNYNGQPKRDYPRDDEELLEVSQEQMDLIQEFQRSCRKNLKMIKDDEVVQVCVENDFNRAAISAYFAKFQTTDKYKGLQEFEWNTTQTIQEKNQQRRRKVFMAGLNKKLEAKNAKIQEQKRKEEAEQEKEREAKQALIDAEKAEKKRLKFEKKQEKRAAKRDAKKAERSTEQLALDIVNSTVAPQAFSSAAEVNPIAVKDQDSDAEKAAKKAAK